MQILKRAFFARNPVEVARDLIGCEFIHKTARGEIHGRIVETEAYGDQNDLASHARFFSRKRNEIMFGKPGILYIYHIYGIFYLTNIICENAGKSGAVLIRAAEITAGKGLAEKNLELSKFVKLNDKLATGPGKFSTAFGISKTSNGLDISASKGEIWLEEATPDDNIVAAKRVGVDYAAHCRDLLWRFYLENNHFVSRK